MPIRRYCQGPKGSQFQSWTNRWEIYLPNPDRAHWASVKNTHTHCERQTHSNSTNNHRQHILSVSIIEWRLCAWLRAKLFNPQSCFHVYSYVSDEKTEARERVSQLPEVQQPMNGCLVPEPILLAWVLYCFLLYIYFQTKDRFPENAGQDSNPWWWWSWWW